MKYMVSLMQKGFDNNFRFTILENCNPRDLEKKEHMDAEIEDPIPTWAAYRPLILILFVLYYAIESFFILGSEKGRGYRGGVLYFNSPLEDSLSSPCDDNTCSHDFV